jgi:nucleoside-diphosphate-sugar epimerase
LHFAPAAESSAAFARNPHADSRTRHLIAALSSPGSLPQRLVYISTSGVYGDCGGARFDETRPPAPTTARAARRVDAERQLRRWSRRSGVRTSILRVPGIYAAERLPLARLGSATPVLRTEDDVFTNHIHADDLAHAAWRALLRGGNNRIYHVTDHSELRMGDYFDCVADAFALPRPPRIARADAAQRISPMLLSFMSESRRLDNRRMHIELGVELAWPRVEDAMRRIAARQGHTKGEKI